MSTQGDPTDHLLHDLMPPHHEPEPSLLVVCLDDHGNHLTTLVTPHDQPKGLHLSRDKPESRHPNSITLQGPHLPDEASFRLLACRIAARRHHAQDSDNPAQWLLALLIPY